MSRPRTRFRTRHGLWLLPAAALWLPLGASAQEQSAAGTVGKGEFPGLQLLPPGSVLHGISLPRYENHRVTALFTAERMEIKSRSLVSLAGVKAHLYAEDGGITDVESNEARYDFSTSRATSTTQTQLTSPRLEAQGCGLVYDNERQIGILKGPIQSAIRSNDAGTALSTPTKKEP